MHIALVLVEVRGGATKDLLHRLHDASEAVAFIGVAVDAPFRGLPSVEYEEHVVPHPDRVDLPAKASHACMGVGVQDGILALALVLPVRIPRVALVVDLVRGIRNVVEHASRGVLRMRSINAHARVAAPLHAR